MASSAASASPTATTCWWSHDASMWATSVVRTRARTHPHTPTPTHTHPHKPSAHTYALYCSNCSDLTALLCERLKCSHAHVHPLQHQRALACWVFQAGLFPDKEAEDVKRCYVVLFSKPFAAADITTYNLGIQMQVCWGIANLYCATHTQCCDLHGSRCAALHRPA
ncbi:hypothetical protein COO60DRAFT_792125 [Scenedesmus sp. NREL 46B-D3]|nr:hypothetical protein COO60DRAFT_792125 [Scenedesmus sp. NREL 46B-D3]